MTNKIFKIKNIAVISLGILMVILGFYLLGRPPVDGPVSLNVAPIILTLAFVIVIPLGILIGGKDSEE